MKNGVWVSVSAGAIAVSICLSSCVKTIYIPQEKAFIVDKLNQCEKELDNCVDMCDALANP